MGGMQEMGDQKAASGLSRKNVGRGGRPTVVLGSSERALKVAAAIDDNHDLGLLATDVLEIAGGDLLAKMLLEFRSHVVVIAPEPEQIVAVDKLLPTLRLVWPKVGIVVPSLHTLLVGKRVPVLLDEGTMLVWSSNSLSQRSARMAKRAIDIVGSALGLLAFSPFFLAVCLHAAFARQPAFYGHKRIGRFGGVFTCHKFRTMVVNATDVLDDLLASDPAARREWEATYKLKNDPRITKIGSFLRRTSLDELPQLWNVLKGDMSLVGPRPIVEDELRYYGDQAQSYLNVKPGLTGVWQVSGRTDTSYEERVSLDRWYVMHWRLWYDIVILFKTISVMLRRSGAY